MTSVYGMVSAMVANYRRVTGATGKVTFPQMFNATVSAAFNGGGYHVDEIQKRFALYTGTDTDYIALGYDTQSSAFSSYVATLDCMDGTSKMTIWNANGWKSYRYMESFCMWGQYLGQVSNGGQVMMLDVIAHVKSAAMGSKFMSLVSRGGRLYLDHHLVSLVAAASSGASSWDNPSVASFMVGQSVQYWPSRGLVSLREKTVIAHIAGLSSRSHIAVCMDAANVAVEYWG